MRYDISEMLNLLSNGDISESDFWAMIRLSQRDFASVVGVSAGYCNRLAAMGLLILNPQKHVKALESFQRFWEMYLPPWRREELILAAVEEVERFTDNSSFNCNELGSSSSASSTQRRQRRGGRLKATSFLTAVQVLRERILAAELTRLRAEIILRFFDGLPMELTAALDKIRATIWQLRCRYRNARKELFHSLTAASLPPRVLEVMRRRYVDCLPVATVAAEMNLSTRQIFRLQRRGIEMLGGDKIKQLNFPAPREMLDVVRAAQ